MCEFKVIVNGEIVFRDAVYAIAEGKKVIVKDVLGESKELDNVEIAEIDVKTGRLVLRARVA
jgi:predicted RNA-binding protein